MEAGRLLIIATSALLLSLPFAGVPSNGQPMKSRIVRIAELEIDPAQLDSYKAALREEIETSIRVEPGVLTLYAVSVKGNPTLIRILEVYADADAYKAHLKTPHFQRYKVSTQAMVKSLKLVETEPIVLGAKTK